MASLYCGVKPDLSRELFWADRPPTEASHGAEYAYCIGPFYTTRGGEMSYRPTARGCCKTTAREISDRHWGHWRWLQCLAQHRYARAIALWHNLYGVRPRGLCVTGRGMRLNFVK